MPKTVFHFGVPAAELFGSLLTSTRLQRRSAAVLFCNPLGEEASRSHRLFRVLAAQLERLGYASLRFDYRSTGDSAGEETAATLDMWIDDIEQAADELARRTATSRVVLVGVRLGATLAAMATTAGRMRVRHLLLWDPVVEGAQHLEDLAAAHDAYLMDEAGSNRPRIKSQGADLREYLGLPLDETMRGQLRALDLSAVEPLADRITVIHTRESKDSRTLRAAWDGRPGVTWVDLPAGQNWNSDSALNAATVPADLIRTMITSIQEHSP